MYQFLSLILPPSLFCDWCDKEVTVKMDVDISKLFCQELQLQLSPKKCMDWGCKKYRGIFVHSYQLRLDFASYYRVDQKKVGSQKQWP